MYSQVPQHIWLEIRTCRCVGGRKSEVSLNRKLEGRIARIENMPHILQHGNLRPIVSFIGLNACLVLSVSPVYDFICDLPYWERQRERRRLARESSAPGDAANAEASSPDRSGSG